MMGLSMIPRLLTVRPCAMPDCESRAMFNEDGEQDVYCFDHALGESISLNKSLTEARAIEDARLFTAAFGGKPKTNHATGTCKDCNARRSLCDVHIGEFYGGLA